MKPLELHDQHHLEAAEGWAELGNHLEATEELERITAEYRAHPAVLEVRWQIYAKAKKCEGALDIASALIWFRMKGKRKKTQINFNQFWLAAFGLWMKHN